MAYTRTTWVDGTTPVNAADLNNIETELVTLDALPRIPAVVNGQWLKGVGGAVVWAAIAAGDIPDISGTYQAKSEKALANGYPSLDATGKVPAAQLPAGGGGVTYRGAYAGATAYNPGDIVTYNGIDYMAAQASTGQTPPPSGPYAAIGTVLPGSPVDGQEFVLVDSLTAPTYAWRFKYVAASTSPYKWMFIGGGDWVGALTTPETSTTRSAWFDLPTVGPRIFVPRAGDYLVTASIAATDTIASAQIGLGPCIGATNPNQATYSVIGPSANSNATVTFTFPMLALAAGADLRLRYASFAAAGTAQFNWRVLAVRPIRVS